MENYILPENKNVTIVNILRPSAFASFSLSATWKKNFQIFKQTLLTLREENFAKEKIAELKIANKWSKKSWIAELKIANRPPSLEIAELKIAILRFCLKNMELKLAFSQNF